MRCRSPLVFFVAVGACAACSDAAEPEESATADAGVDAAEEAHDHGGNGVHQLAFPSCQSIMDACHWLDQGRPGRIHECHELALDAQDDAACAARLDECIDVCSLGGSRDASAGD